MITAIVTACERVEQTLDTLTTIARCEPPPAEVLVYVDGNDAEVIDAVRRAHAGVRVLGGDARIGPGGARNVLIAAASQPIVTSFDDDSRPIDRDYFARVAALFGRVPDASVLGGFVYHRHETIGADEKSAAWVADFSGGACAYRREHFLATGGYVSVETAYGMEEVDLALRLHAQGRRVLQTPWLRVFHDTDLARHANPDVTAASIENIALLTYLRYPPSLWLIGAVQVAKRIGWLLTHGRQRGVVRGLAGIRKTLQLHQSARRLVPAAAVRSYLQLRRRPVPIEWSAA